MKRKLIVAALVMAAVLGGCTGKNEHGLRADRPTVITIWNYYNGAQKETFDRLVKEFNETEGEKRGIVVESVSKGTIAELNQAIMASMNGEVGAPDVPDALSAYADTVYEIDQAGKAVDLTKYLTDEELSQYVDAYVEEGRFMGTGLKLFPVAKSTELLAVNQTDWEDFAEECGIPIENLSTWEGIAETAKLFYEWSGGKALFGRDAFANYMIIGSRQLGHEIYKVRDGEPELDFDKDTMRRLWDNYYVPYINGYYGSYGKFRSDDVKTGKLTAIVCSTSGITYFPSSVTLEDGTNYEIETRAYPLPNFEGTAKSAVQQGAGMLVLASNETREYATVQFLKWFTDVSNNVEFALDSAYLPVKKEANDPMVIEQIIHEKGIPVTDTVMQSVEVGLSIVNQYDLYTTKAFQGGQQAREILNNSMDQEARNAREAVLSLIQSGVSREEAVRQYDNDETFNAWYEDTLSQLEQIGENYGKKK